MTELAKEQCVPCRGGESALDPVELDALLALTPEWHVDDTRGYATLTRTFKVKAFAGALKLANQIGLAADEVDHHPELRVEYGRLTVTWWTHTIPGLHRNDFIMAARTDSLFENLR